MQKHYPVGLFITIIAALLFSIKAIFIKIAYEYGASVDVVMTLRVLFSLPIYIWTFLALAKSSGYVKTTSPKQLVLIAILGIFGYYFAAYLDLTGLKYISANLERLIIYLYPTLVVILSALFFNRSITKTTLLCITLSYAGVSIVFLQDFSLSNTSSEPIPAIHFLGFSISSLAWGAAITLASAACFAIYITFSQPIIQQVGSAYFTVIAMSIASIAILIHASFTLSVTELLNQTLMIYAMSACAAILCTVLPSFLLAEGIKKIGANNASMTSAIGPFGTLLTANLFLGEAVTSYHLVGLLLVVLGIVLMAKQSD